MKSILFAVLTVANGGVPQTTTFPTDDCKTSMEQVVKSYGLSSFIKSWSVKSITADNGKLHLKVTCG